MKKKYRTITVDQVEYTYVVNDGHLNRVWKNKKLIFDDRVDGYSVHDEENNVRPKLITQFIKTLV